MLDSSRTDAGDAAGFFRLIDAEVPYRLLDEETEGLELNVERNPAEAQSYKDRYLRVCGEILAIHPKFIDVYVHVAQMLFNDGEKEAARIWAQRGLDVALPLIPIDYTGYIEYMYHNNRAFLRLHKLRLLCQFEQLRALSGVERTALREELLVDAELHLSWNPQDNLGVRALL